MLLERGQEKRYFMKKPGFILTEIIFSVILAASVSAVGVLIYDLNTNQQHIDRLNPFAQKPSTTASDTKKATPKAETSSTASQTSAVPEKTSQAADTSSADASETSVPTIQLAAEPKDLKQQPQELVDALGIYGYTIEGFILGDHLIMVDTTSSDSPTKAKIYCYEQNDNGYWWNIAGDNKPLCTEAYIGENGSNFEPAYDSKTTPGGLFFAGQGFYLDDKPDTTYPLFPITEETYWVTDPQSRFFNQHIEGTADKDWSKADHMVTSEKSYQYGLVINYNTEEPDPEKAAAVFLRCGNTPTEGSVAVPEEVMKTILEWLGEDSSVMFFINV